MFLINRLFEPLFGNLYRIRFDIQHLGGIEASKENKIMRPENRIFFDRRAVLREKLKVNPRFTDKFICRKCDIRVLLVADSFLYFNDEDFGLSDLVSILESTNHPSAKVTVTRAHRGNPGSARLNGADRNFKFTSQALKNIDVVMLMAASRNSGRFTSSELKALAKFMNNGGGVFATGDHDSLGRAMGGDLMRVRSMRKWFYPNPGPFGEPVAPDGGSADRHDTNRPGHNGAFSFDDQSDDIPQTIIPIYQTVSQFGFNQVREPHPLLCASDGVIKVLPDHPHEGECMVPTEHDRQFTYAGSKFKEYPTLPNGDKLLPVIVAKARMRAGAEVPPNKPPIAGGTFNVISAYDGHVVKVGRVTCDATWHHFININLTGADSAPANDPKSMGFLASASGEQAFEKIKAYFRNIPIWLAPPKLQACMRNRRIWNIIRKPYFYEEFEIAHISRVKLSVRELADIGGFIRKYPELDASKCQTRRWVIDLLVPELIEKVPDFACLLDPCLRPPGAQPDPVPFIDPGLVLDLTLGQIAVTMVTEAVKLEENGVQAALNDSALAKMTRKSVIDALKHVSDDMDLRVKRARKILPQIKAL